MALFDWIIAGIILLVLLFLVFSVVSFTGRARREDAALAERFGEAWTEYKNAPNS